MKQRLVSISCLACVIACAVANGDAPVTQPTAAAAARNYYQVLDQRMAQGEPLTLEFLDQVYIWSQRCAKSEDEEAKSKTDRVAAWRAHEKRMEELRDTVIGSKDSHRDGSRWAVVYYAADAKTAADRAERD